MGTPGRRRALKALARARNSNLERIAEGRPPMVEGHRVAPGYHGMPHSAAEAKKRLAASLVAACHSAACAPPPAGKGGSSSGGGGGSVSPSQRARIGNVRVRNEANRKIHQRLDEIKARRAAGKPVRNGITHEEKRLLKTHIAARRAINSEIDARGGRRTASPDRAAARTAKRQEQAQRIQMLKKRQEAMKSITSGKATPEAKQAYVRSNKAIIEQMPTGRLTRKIRADDKAATTGRGNGRKRQALTKAWRDGYEDIRAGVTAAAPPRGGARPTKSGYGHYKSSIGGRSPSLRWPHLYDILRAKGYSKEKSARISNSRVGMRKTGQIKGLPFKQAENPKALARVLKKSMKR